MDGLSKVPDAPNIAGQNEAYLVAQLQAFKSGRRKNESMSVVAAPLSDSDIAARAAGSRYDICCVPRARRYATCSRT